MCPNIKSSADCDGSHAGALIVIHKCLEARHFGRDAEIQRPWMAIYGLALFLNQALVQPASYRPWHWIPASMTGMTTFPVWLDLCITTSAGAWERSNCRYMFFYLSQSPAFCRYFTLNLSQFTRFL